MDVAPAGLAGRNGGFSDVWKMDAKTERKTESD